jgi:DNA-binding CsgD family transcriptional regulator
MASAQEDRRRALLEAAEKVANAGSWEWVPSREELLWSDNMFRILGIEPGDVEPSPEYLISVAHPDDREWLLQTVEGMRHQARPDPVDYRIIRPDGVVRHLRSTMAVIEERDGLPFRQVGCVQDRTEQFRAEREIAAHFAVSDALASWDGLDVTGPRLLCDLAVAMGFIAGVLWVPVDGILAPRLMWSDQRVQLPRFTAETWRTRLARGTGLPGQAWQQGAPVSRVTAARPPLNGREHAAVDDGLRGRVAIPAISGSEVLAIVELLSREEAELTERLMRSLTGIAYELGAFLDRRRGELDGPVLTARELQVLQLSAHGFSAPASAERLGISAATVRTHLEHIYAKLGVGDRASAVATALRRGLID